jgi:hypothetical protein
VVEEDQGDVIVVTSFLQQGRDYVRGGGGPRHRVGDGSCNLGIYVHMYVCMYTLCMHIRIYVCTHTYVCVSLSLSLALFLCVCITDRRVA